jgi:hypothetical protein
MIITNPGTYVVHEHHLSRICLSRQMMGCEKSSGPHTVFPWAEMWLSAVRSDSQVEGARVAQTRESKFHGKEARSELQRDAHWMSAPRENRAYPVLWGAHRFIWLVDPVAPFVQKYYRRIWKRIESCEHRIRSIGARDISEWESPDPMKTRNADRCWSRELDIDIGVREQRRSGIWQKRLY